MSRVAASLPPIPYPIERTALDPDPAMSEYRSSPIRPLRYPDGVVGWFVSSHELARETLGHPSTVVGGHAVTDRFARLGEAYQVLLDRRSESGRPAMKGQFGAMNPPDHTRYRRLLGGSFTPKAVQRMTPVIEGLVDRALDAMAPALEADGVVDAVSGLALPVALGTICGFLGLPFDPAWHGDVVVADVEAFDPVEYAAVVEEHMDAVERALENFRERPNDGLLKDLIDRDELDDEEFLGLAYLLLHVGHHTTMNVIGLGLATLLGDRRHWEALVADPDSVGAVVEELLRYISVFHIGTVTRVATEDLRLGGVPVTAGDRISVSVMAANRDPDWRADPDVFDPSRVPLDHLAFGYGIHQCIGQHLARLELGILFRRLVTRYPDLRLAIPIEDIPLLPLGTDMFGVRSLPLQRGR